MQSMIENFQISILVIEIFQVFIVAKIYITHFTKATIENSNGIKKNGKITFISQSAETSTRTFEIEIEADNSDLSFKSGITTSIMIEGSELFDFISFFIPVAIDCGVNPYE